MSKKSKVKNLTIPQVKKILEGIDEEKIDHFQHRTYNYISKFSKVEAETAEKILEKLTKEFDLEEEEAVQIINCMPKSIEELKPFLAKKHGKGKVSYCKECGSPSSKAECRVCEQLKKLSL